jgi:hypothetical protein
MTLWPLGKIIFIPDQTISREKNRSLTQRLNVLRRKAQLQLLPEKVSEEELIQNLKGDEFTLVLAPAHKYLRWNKVEGAFGPSRKTGPAFAGYFAQNIEEKEKTHLFERLTPRLLLFDFEKSTPSETLIWISALAQEKQRFGLEPLISPDATIYFDRWDESSDVFLKMEKTLALPEVQSELWKPHLNTLRISLLGLWSWIYEEGPGKETLSQSQRAKALFLISANEKNVYMRISTVFPGWRQKDLLSAFSKSLEKKSSPFSLFFQNADFIRLQTIDDGPDLDLTLGFSAEGFLDAASQKIPTLWIEPIGSSLIESIHHDSLPEDFSSRYQPLNAVSSSQTRQSNSNRLISEKINQKMGRLIEDNQKLKQDLREHQEVIRELKNGGVGSAPPLAPPDVPALIEALQEKYFDGQFQIRQFEYDIQKVNRLGGDEKVIKALDLKMKSLIKKQDEWISELASIIRRVKEERDAG